MSPVTQALHTHRRGHGRALVLIASTLLVSAVALTWCWNTVLHGVFAAPEIKFVHAFAVIFACAAFAATLGMTWRLATGAGTAPAHGGPEPAP